MRTVASLTLCLGLLSGCEQPPAQKQTASESPRPVTEHLPDFTQFQNTDDKKQAFFDFLMPLIEQVNDDVLSIRTELEAMTPPLTEAQQTRLQQLVRRYRIQEETQTEQIQRLLTRVLPIPPSLVLAQAANESAWGTSRFATEGNNLFGQWCFKRGCGLVPLDRPEGDRHEVAVFDTPLDSVRSYVRNLNTHPEYQQLRQIRRQQWQTQGYADGKALASGLLGYSERREEYVEEIRSMIRYNQLSQYDQPDASASLPQG
ncbi:hypothetical protein CHH28_16920 [Bacterioplanes sanyensis]|uniref:Mannosyl-glycoprotein endo-beta-N-acetylglucosamidase-like domain-containing protein n=1 Tax=Bacterioplanes sanyensis TaxID=1249553 RepID=A0A222FMJ7_9GAMM|nr:glucosaminidase domain-containing protein [Bacterioplanes sanyensis]ASP40255.1 hypothetical protein CHH28_16920 [Bacterioplanes sanyensis]